MDTSTESEIYDRTPRYRTRSQRSRDRGAVRDVQISEISEKMSTMANALESTSKHLNKVDHVLSKCKDEQAAAMAEFRENIEDSISQLQTQRLRGCNRTRCDYTSTSRLNESDRDHFSSESETQRFQANSPLRAERRRFNPSYMERRLHEQEREKRGLEQPLHHKIQPKNVDENIFERFFQVESERSKMEVDLKNALILLEQSEDRRESLAGQVEGMRGELQRTGFVRSELEKEIFELREQLHRASGMGEVEELKRALAHEKKEKEQLSLKVRELTLDLARREQTEVYLLEQLKKLQSCEKTEKQQIEAQLEETKRSRDGLKTRAQEAICQWRAKCKRLQKELEDAAEERETSHAQIKSLSQQTEAARRELGDILGRLAHQEEELHHKDVELSDSRQRQLFLEEEIREVREAYTSLEQDAQNQLRILERLKEESHRLEEQANSVAHRQQMEEDKLQNKLKQVTFSHAQLVQRLAKEGKLRKELQKSHSELQARITTVQEERCTFEQQLKLQKEVHQKAIQERMSKERDLQDTLRDTTQERDKIKEQLKYAQGDADSYKELCDKLHCKLDRIKHECDKMAAQLSTKEDAYVLLERQHLLLQKELDDQVRSKERRRSSEAEVNQLKEKVSRLEREQEAMLTAITEELDNACSSLARNGEDKLQVIYQKPGLVQDPHLRLAETKSKVRWLCEEMRERNRQHQQTKDQLKALRNSRDMEQDDFLQRLDQQEKLLHSLSKEKHECESTHKFQEYRDKYKYIDVTSRSQPFSALSPSLQGCKAFLNSSLRSGSLLPSKCLTSLGLGSSRVNTTTTN